MKTILRFLCALCILAFYVNPVHGANESSQLTIELRDGSRVVGKTLEGSLSFHSAALGDMKLSWAGIRSIEYATDNGAARLTATNGDGFTVQFATDTLGVETGFGKTELPVKLIRNIKVSPPASPNFPASPAETDSRLAIELRDGSHVVGKGLDKTLNFHSTAMGDLKLGWSAIRSIEYSATNADLARLTATNGDVYEVQFAASTMRMETSFGKTELPVKLIRSIKVSTMTSWGQLPSGLVALWSGEGDGNDSAGGNTAMLIGNVTFADGKVGRAFNFNGMNDYISISSDCLFNSTNDATLAFWLNTPANAHQAVFWTRSDMSDINRFNFFVNGDATFGFDYRSPNGVLHNLVNNSPILRNVWIHLTITRSAGNFYSLYRDGALVATAIDAASYLPTAIGWHFSGRFSYMFQGLLDEVSIYNRALSASEIQAVYEKQK